jgi:putative effector of murein hydrolase LrgA (UPF0299 family)
MTSTKPDKPRTVSLRVALIALGIFAIVWTLAFWLDLHFGPFRPKTVWGWVLVVLVVSQLMDLLMSGILVPALRTWREERSKRQSQPTGRN